MPDPKLVEVDEAELLSLRRTGAAIASVLKNPAARKKFAQAVKDIGLDDPLAKEADQVDPVEARFADMQKRNDELAKQIADDKAERERNAKLGALQAEQERGFSDLRAQKWTDDGIAQVKKVMEDKGILDVAIAAKWVESQMPPQNPVTPSSGGWGFLENVPDTDTDLKKLIETKGENAGVLNNLINAGLAEVRGTPARR